MPEPSPSREHRHGLLAGLFDPFIAEGADSMHAHRTRVVVICFLVVLLLTGRGVLNQVLWGSWIVATGHAIFALLAAFFLLKFRRDQNLGMAAQAVMALTVSSTLMATALTGGLRGANITPWLAIIVGAVLILGRRGIPWVFLAVLFPFLFAMAEATGVVFPDSVAPEGRSLDDFITWMSMAIVLAVFTLNWETARERAMAQAREAARVKSRFLANISHELRTPLQVLGSTLELLERSDPGRPRYELIVRANQHTAVLSQLVDDLLDLSGAQRGQLDLRDIDFDLGALCTELVDANLPLATAKGLGLELQMDGWLRWVRGDPSRLRQVLSALVQNAIKFTDEGQVTLEVRVAEAGQVHFSIQDTGIGLPESELDHVFSEFYQVDDSPTRKAQGAGLGLYIAQEIVHRMGGRIEVSSREGEGSRFGFSVPLPGAKGSRPVSIDDPDAVALRILLVEDNDDAREMVSELLQALGHEVWSAVNGEDAVERWREAGADIILMDVQMPTMDGITASRLIRSEESEQGRDRTPIVAMTGHCTQEDRDLCAAAGMGSFLQKPFRLAQLQEVLSQLETDFADESEPAPA